MLVGGGGGGGGDYGYGVDHHFQHNFSYIVAVSFIGEENQRKPPTCRNSRFARFY